MDSDKAVSPVIAVILMVAITVVLAAVVYTWVSGFSGQNNEVAGTLALQSSGEEAGDWSFIVTSAAGVDWDDLDILTDGALEYGDASGEWCAQRAGACLADPEGQTVRAGDSLVLFDATEGETLRVVDGPANSLLVEIVLR